MGFRPFHTPFFAGASSSTSTVPEPYHCAIGGHTYITEPTKCHRQFISQLRPAQDQGEEPGETTLNPENLWRRSQSSWHYGAGQTWFDSSRDAERHRYRASKGVNVWTPFELSMLRDANTKKLTATGTNLALYSDPVTGKLWVVDGVDVKVTANPSAAAPTFTTCTGLPGSNIVSITSTGAFVFVVTAGGAVYRTSNTTTVFASWYSATNVSGVQYANGRLFGWNNADGSLFELTAAAALTALFTHPHSGFAWDQVVGAPNASYLIGHLGGSTEVYRTDVTDATGALSAPRLSASILNETVTAACEQGGYVILATKFSDGVGRIRLCQIINTYTSTGGSLSVGPDMFSELGQRPTGPIDALHPTGRFIYFSWKNLDAVCTGVGRLDLSTFTQPLVPAYATDQMAGVTGAAVQGAVLDVVFNAVSGQLWFVVSGVGLYGTTGGTHFMADNYLYSGRVRYGLLDTKVFAQIQMRAAALPSTSVTATVLLDTGDSLGAITVYGDNDGVLNPATLPHSTGEWAEVRLVLDDDGAGGSAVLSWWVLSAIPVPGALEQIVMCLQMRDQTFNGPGEDAVQVTVDVEAEVQYLRSLVVSRSIVAFQSGNRIEDVYMNNVEQVPDRLSPGNRHWEGYVNVEMKTLKSGT